MPAVAQLLAGSRKPDRSKVIAQTKRDTLVLEVGGWAWGDDPTLEKKPMFRKPQRCLGPAVNRDEWRRLMNEAKGRKGL